MRAQAFAFDRMDVLARELELDGGSATQPSIDWAAVREVRRPVAVVIRIGHYSGSGSADAAAGRQVIAACRQALERARQAGVEPAELQIDYDCATARLSAYTGWIQAIRREVSPPGLTVTALPAWLDAAAFRSLIAQVDAYVLQVHSVDRPSRPGGSAVSLCDPKRAIRWIEQAKGLNRPFRVALPDYGYRMGFDAHGQLAGIQAEGVDREWPEGTQLETVMADPAAIAAIVRHVHHHPAPSLLGLAWFRLPMPGDDLTWAGPTLAAVRLGIAPQADLRLEVSAAEDGANDLFVVNRGNGAGAVAATLTLPARGDGLAGWDLAADWRGSTDDRGDLQIRPASAAQLDPLRPGERRRIGWVRFGPAS